MLLIGLGQLCSTHVCGPVKFCVALFRFLQ